MVMFGFCDFIALVFVLAIKSSSSLSCYNCDETVVTITNITVPSGGAKNDVNDTYLMISVDYHADENGSMVIQWETSHRAYGDNEDFVRLDLTFKRNRSYGYGFTDYCLTNASNAPELT